MRRQSSETQQISHDQCPHTDSVSLQNALIVLIPIMITCNQ